MWRRRPSDDVSDPPLCRPNSIILGGRAVSCVASSLCCIGQFWRDTAVCSRPSYFDEKNAAVTQSGVEAFIKRQTGQLTFLSRRLHAPLRVVLLIPPRVRGDRMHSRRCSGVAARYTTVHHSELISSAQFRTARAGSGPPDTVAAKFTTKPDDKTLGTSLFSSLLVPSRFIF